MKLFNYVILLIVSYNQVIGLEENDKSAGLFTVRSLNSQLKNFLEHDLRIIFRTVEPIVDPYVSQEQLFEYNDETIMLNVKLNNFTVVNLSNYIVKSSNLNIWNKKVNVDFNFPTITSDGFYKIDARYKNIPYKGNGYYNVTVRDFSISAEAYFKIIGGVQIKSLDIKIALGSFDFSASNDYFETEEESKEWSANISQLVPTFIADNHDSIVELVTPKLLAAINQQLHNNNNNELKHKNNDGPPTISNISGYNHSAAIYCINFYMHMHSKKSAE